MPNRTSPKPEERDAEGAAARRRLIERDSELSRLARLLDEAEDGNGGVVLLRGAPGIGKTELLAAVREHAAAAGLNVLAARGGELERDFPFGCVRQLFEPYIRSHPELREELFAEDARLATPALWAPPAQGEHEHDPGFGTLHGLYWLTANLAEHGGLVLLLDDAHWADPATLRYLSFLAPRLDGVAALVVAATRPGDLAGPAAPLLAALAADSATETIEPEPLSAAGVEEIVAARLPTASGDGARFRAATGGNPFLLDELLRELERGEARLDRIDEVGPERVAAAVGTRLEGLGPQAPRLAQALAVLGDGADLRLVTQLAEIAAEEAAALVDRLAAAALLEPTLPLRYLHPIVRNSVYGRLMPAERDRWHRRAAALLAAAGAGAEVVALHLLATEPAGEEAAVATLCEAAGAAVLRGAPETAIHFFERALAEPPAEPADRARVLLGIGRAGAQLGDPRALAWLSEALELGDGSQIGMDAARALAMALLFTGGEGAELRRVCERVRDRAATADQLGERLEQWLVGFDGVAPATRAASRSLGQANLERALAGEDLGPCLLASAAFEAAIAGIGGAAAGELAERAAAAGLLEISGPEYPEPILALCALVLGERFESAELLLAGGYEIVRAEGDARGFAGAIAFRAWARYREGRVTEVLADAELYPQFPLPSIADLTMASVNVQALVDDGRLEQAAAIAGLVEALPIDRELTAYQRFAESLAALRLAQGDAKGALEAAERSARWETAIGIDAGTWVPWRAQAALARATLGDRRRALELAREQADLAEAFGAPGMLGEALRALGLVEGGKDGTATLERAVEVLSESDRQLELARALVDLGAALRRGGKRVAAREALARGGEIARRLGARALAARALDEQVAAGARPHRPVSDDEDSLTPSEHRVAMMAADGMRNKEIAQALFVTVKTVETHLRHVYRKLDIGSRAQLPGRLST